MEKLIWLDKSEADTRECLQSNYRDDIRLLNKLVYFITKSIETINNSQKDADTPLTIEQLTQSQDEKLLCSKVSRSILLHLVDNIQAMRLNTFCGYLSASLACLRSAIESLRIADASSKNSSVAKNWLNSLEFQKPKGYEVPPPIAEIMKKYDSMSKGGSHPHQRAKIYSSLLKPNAKQILGAEQHDKLLSEYFRGLHQVLANILLYLVHEYECVANNEAFLSEEYKLLFEELDSKFGIKFIDN